MKTILDHGKRQGFAQIVLLVLLALGFLGAGGVYLAKRNSPAPVVASAPVVEPEPVVEQVATSTELVPLPEEAGAEPATSPVVPVTKPVPSPTPVVVAPAPTPAPAPEPDQLADDRYFLESVLIVVRSDKAAWVKYAEDAAGRQASSFRALAAHTDTIDTGGNQVVIQNLAKFKQHLLNEAGGYAADKTEVRSDYEKVHGKVEAAISARLATLTATNLLTSAEVQEYGGYISTAHSVAASIENTRWTSFKNNLYDESFRDLWLLYETPTVVDQLLLTAEQSAKPVVARPVSP